MEDRITMLLTDENNDFDSWTNIIKEIEEISPDDIERLSFVYDSFLSKFPLCYGYWRKYAYHKAHLCTINEAVEVYERAIQAAPYSVDLWANYCSFAIQFYENLDDTRRLFERGLSFVGKDYLCYILWDKYIGFEHFHKQWSNLAHIYIKILKFPSKKLHHYYKSFKNLIAIWEEEIRGKNNNFLPQEFGCDSEFSESIACTNLEIANIIRDFVDQPDGTFNPDMFKKYRRTGEHFYNRSSQLYMKISSFETAIRRPYFHAKPLHDCQLNNWHRYLDFVEGQGDFDWTMKLYERCLIPCANYQEFWIRYVEYLESRGGRELANLALERASHIYLKGIPSFHYYSARYKEQIGDCSGARASFLLCKKCSTANFIEHVDREANMEKRLGNMEAAYLIYEQAILIAEEKKMLEIMSLLYIHFSRFMFAVKRSVDAAIEIFLKGIAAIPQSRSLIQGLLQFMITHGGPSQINKADSIVSAAIVVMPGADQFLSTTDREATSYLFIEFVDLYGTIYEINKAWDRHIKLFPYSSRLDSSYGSNLSDFYNLESDAYKTSETCKLPTHHQSEESRVTSSENLVSKEKISPCPFEGIQALKLNVKEGNGTNGKAGLIVECSDSVNEAGHEASIMSMNELPPVSTDSKDSKIIDQVQQEPCLDFNAMGAPALESLSINCHGDQHQQRQSPCPPNPQNEENHKSDSSTLIGDDKPHQVTSSCVENIYRNIDSMGTLTGLLDSNKENMQTQLTSHVRSQTDSDLACATTISSPGTARNLPEIESQEQSHLQQPMGENSQEATGGEKSTQNHYREDTSVSSFSASTPQSKQVSAQHLHSPVSNKQILNTCPSQQDSRPSEQQMANVQTHQISAAALPPQNPSTHGFSSSQPQPVNQSVSQFQSDANQYVSQGNENYGYFQNAQEYSQQLWYYYHQQQLYYMQLQQQNLQLQQQQAGNGQSSQMHGHFQPSLSQQNSQTQQMHQQQHYYPPQETTSLQPQNHHLLQFQQQQQQQTHHHLQQVQHQQLSLQQQQLMLQQQHHLFIQQKRQEQPLSPQQLPITASQIQTLSNYYLHAQVYPDNQYQQAHVQQNDLPEDLPISLDIANTEVELPSSHNQTPTKT